MRYLKIETLDKGWCDRDQVLLHAAFQILVDFIEKEDPENIDWNSNELHRRAWREIKLISLVEGNQAKQKKPSR